MLARSFLIKSSSKLLVTRTGIKAQSSLNLGRIRPLILELLAFEWRKFHTFELEYLWSLLANLDQTLCVASLGWGKGCIRFWARLTLAHWTQVSDRCPLGYLCLLCFLLEKSGPSWFSVCAVSYSSHVMKKPVFAKCQQQRRSAFVFRCLDNIIHMLAKSGISRL